MPIIHHLAAASTSSKTFRWCFAPQRGAWGFVVESEACGDGGTGALGDGAAGWENQGGPLSPGRAPGGAHPGTALWRRSDRWLEPDKEFPDRLFVGGCRPKKTWRAPTSEPLRTRAMLLPGTWCVTDIRFQWCAEKFVCRKRGPPSFGPLGLNPPLWWFFRQDLCHNPSD